ncbi:hypothetical protein C8R47DRAFT_251641 [Mycena vitilis]|nr:hypothetical protein C8R47DRAFT_251641 [Mycena vitilis]
MVGPQATATSVSRSHWHLGERPSFLNGSSTGAVLGFGLRGRCFAADVCLFCSFLALTSALFGRPPRSSNTRALRPVVSRTHTSGMKLAISRSSGVWRLLNLRVPRLSAPPILPLTDTALRGSVHPRASFPFHQSSRCPFLRLPVADEYMFRSKSNSTALATPRIREGLD